MQFQSRRNEESSGVHFSSSKPIIHQIILPVHTPCHQYHCYISRQILLEPDSEQWKL